MPSTPVGNSLDGGQSAALENFLAQVLGAAPGSPAAGQWYVDSSGTWGFRVYNGSTWVNHATDSALLGGQDSAYHRARANHSGTQLAATISDLAATVQAYRLDQFASPTSNLNLNNQKITSSANASASGDLVPLGQLQTLIQGLTVKLRATLATDGALPANTYANGTAGVGATLTGNSNGALTVNGRVMQVGDSVLVWQEGGGASHLKNGLYLVTATGDASNPYVLTRHENMDQSTEFAAAVITEDAGTEYKNQWFVCVNTGAPTVGTTAIEFALVASPFEPVAGDGVDITGDTFSVDLAADPGLEFVGGDMRVTDAVRKLKHAEDIGDGSSNPVTVVHNLGTTDYTIRIKRLSDDLTVWGVGIEDIDADTIELTFGDIPTTDQYRVVVIA